MAEILPMPRNVSADSSQPNHDVPDEAPVTRAILEEEEDMANKSRAQGCQQQSAMNPPLL